MMTQEDFSLVDSALEHYKAAEGICYRLQEIPISIPYACTELSKSVMFALTAFARYYDMEPCININDAYKLVEAKCPAFKLSLWLRNNILKLDSWLYQQADISRVELKAAIFHVKNFLESNGISVKELSFEEKEHDLYCCRKGQFDFVGYTDSVLRVTKTFLQNEQQPKVEFCPDMYFDALHISNWDKEMQRLSDVYHTSDAESLMSIMRDIYEVYTNTICGYSPADISKL